MTRLRWPGVGMAGIIALLLTTGCPSAQDPAQKESGSNAGRSITAIRYEDISEKAGIQFKHCSGARGKKLMPETVGSGVAFLDYDNDGRLDILYINSTDWPASPDPKPHYPALYHNNGDGTFTDVTEKAGLKIDIYGMGVAVGDYDNDGWPDLYITAIGPNHLYHNNHNGTFTDVTAKAGVAGVPVEPGGVRWKWSTSAAWCDYDKDGVPDLFVCNYVHWTPDTDVYCTSKEGQKAYCAPNNFEGVHCTLYHGRGDGTFEDVSEKMGILAVKPGKSLGVIVADFNGDGWPDLAVTNDTAANFIYLSQGGKRFVERGIESNFAYPESGVPKAGMGIDIADFQNNGHFGLLTGNFSKECLSLYEIGGTDSEGVPSLQDKAYPLGVAQPSLLYLTFGLFFFDYDLDGRQDIFTANGHIDDYVHASDAAITYRERSLLYHNEGDHFTEVGMTSGLAIQKPMVARGCTWGDIENDGTPAIAIVSNNEGGYLFRNQAPHRKGWIGLKLQGIKSTRDGWGALIRVTSGKMVQTFVMAGGGSFLSQHQPWPLFGLNGATSADKVEIDWPSGEKTRLENLSADHYYKIVEGETKATPALP